MKEESHVRGAILDLRTEVRGADHCEGCEEDEEKKATHISIEFSGYNRKSKRKDKRIERDEENSRKGHGDSPDQYHIYKTSDCLTCGRVTFTRVEEKELKEGDREKERWREGGEGGEGGEGEEGSDTELCIVLQSRLGSL